MQGLQGLCHKKEGREKEGREKGNICKSVHNIGIPLPTIGIPLPIYARLVPQYCSWSPFRRGFSECISNTLWHANCNVFYIGARWRHWESKS